MTDIPELTEDELIEVIEYNLSFNIPIKNTLKSFKRLEMLEHFENLYKVGDIKKGLDINYFNYPVD
tara:strand:- start:8115 stop:8312 length:198 start_codon:yes stop_codon:yes gene_type:complete